MRYRIEYIDKPCKIIENRKELIKTLKNSKPDSIADIRKLLKNGVSDSVFETYKKYLRRMRYE